MVRGTVERKLATVLFVDIVDSTQLVTGADPEVVRRRVAEFFDRVSHCVTVHGGIVEKFAGDAVLAAFGIPQAHEDDAERAARAAIGMREAIRELNLEMRIGIEAGEVVVDQADSTFATGEAVNLAARLQQAAMPGEILVGPTANRLARGRLIVEDAGPLELKGMGAAMRAWRSDRRGRRDSRPPQCAARRPRDRAGAASAHVRANAARRPRARVHDLRRAGSRQEPVGPRVRRLGGRRQRAQGSLPAVRRKRDVLAARRDDQVGGRDHRRRAAEEAFEKLRLLRGRCGRRSHRAGVGPTGSGRRRAQPAGDRVGSREVMSTLADVQPLILFFEDIHWAEEPMFDLIEHLADWVRAPLLILCLARPDLLDARPGWGGGRVRSTAIELEPLSEAESQELVTRDRLRPR